MIIRNMLISDYCAVYDLWTKTPGMGLNVSSDSEKGIERFLHRNPNTCFVAETDGEIIGAVLSGHDGRRGLIYHMAVKVSERKRGVGGALLDAVEESLRNEGIEKLYIMVFKNNESGNAFWEKRGYIVPFETIYRAKEISRIERIDT